MTTVETDYGGNWTVGNAIVIVGSEDEMGNAGSGEGRRRRWSIVRPRIREWCKSLKLDEGGQKKCGRSGLRN